MPDSIVFHTIAYCTVFTAYLLTTLVFYPRLWLRHYPEAVRARQAPLTPRERTHTIVHAAFFMGGILLVLPVLSAVFAHGRDASSEIAFRHIATLGIAVSAVDWLLLDWLLMRTWQPRWIIPDGTEAKDWRKSRDFAKDALGFVIGSGLALGWGYLVGMGFD